MKKERDSNFELLRIIAMYMIVLIHANIFLGEFAAYEIAGKYNGVVNGISNTGVSLFILISGYFGVSFNIKKLTKLECKMIVYSLIVLAVSLLAYGNTMSGGDKLELLAKSLLPFSSRNHWFYSCYVLIVLFSEFIEKFISTLDRQNFRAFIVLMLCCFSILPTLLYFEIVQDNGKGLIQMFMMYMVGRYIRLYGEDFGEKHKKWVVGCFWMMWLVNYLSFKHPINIGGIYHTLSKDNSITNVMLAVSLFYIFKGIKLKSKVVNIVASYIFAVFAMNYLLINIAIDLIKARMPWITDQGPWGFWVIPVLSLIILALCILVGVIRDFLLGRVDDVIAEFVEKRLRKLESAIKG